MSMEDLDFEIINGLLLSDANLMRLKNEKRNSRMSIQLHEKNYDLIKYFMRVLDRAQIRYSSGKTGKMNWVSTLTYPIFTELRKKWYPNKIKEVPFDLIITPKTLAFWFMGDGSSFWVGGNHEQKSNIRLSTESFSEKSLSILKDRLENLLESKIHIQKSKSYKIISISKSKDVDTFFSLVEKYILPSFHYKIKFPLVRSREEHWKSIQHLGWEKNRK